MKILNLYAGIGGNRKLWGDDHEITAVLPNKRQVLRNCVLPALGKHVFEQIGKSND